MDVVNLVMSSLPFLKLCVSAPRLLPQYSFCPEDTLDGTHETMDTLILGPMAGLVVLSNWEYNPKHILAALIVRS